MNGKHTDIKNKEKVNVHDFWNKVACGEDLYLKSKYKIFEPFRRTL
jgi:hypothetical protein